MGLRRLVCHEVLAFSNAIAESNYPPVKKTETTNLVCIDALKFTDFSRYWNRPLFPHDFRIETNRTMASARRNSNVVK